MNQSKTHRYKNFLLCDWQLLHNAFMTDYPIILENEQDLWLLTFRNGLFMEEPESDSRKKRTKKCWISARV
jgi:hypothetical protein